jgi:hypothetical protein
MVIENRTGIQRDHMARLRKADLVVITVLAFDFLVAVPAGKYPLWTVHSRLFKELLRLTFWAGVISAGLLPFWVGFRLFRERPGRTLILVECVGVLCWLAALVYMIVSAGAVI